MIFSKIFSSLTAENIYETCSYKQQASPNFQINSSIWNYYYFLITGMHDTVFRISHVFLQEREGLLVFPVVRFIWHSPESLGNLYVRGLLCLLVSQGKTTATTIMHNT